MSVCFLHFHKRVDLCHQVKSYTVLLEPLGLFGLLEFCWGLFCPLGLFGLLEPLGTTVWAVGATGTVWAVGPLGLFGVLDHWDCWAAGPLGLWEPLGLFGLLEPLGLFGLLEPLGLLLEPMFGLLLFGLLEPLGLWDCWAGC